jgi:hypothetical protein
MSITTRRSYTTSRTVIDTVTSTAGTAVGDSSNDAVAELFAARALTCTVDFGSSDSDMAVTSITGVPWIVNGGAFVCNVVGRPDVSGADDEDALLDQVRAVVTNIVDGVSCDVVAHAPDGTGGVYLVHIVGV